MEAGKAGLHAQSQILHMSIPHIFRIGQRAEPKGVLLAYGTLIFFASSVYWSCKAGGAPAANSRAISTMRC